MLNNRGFCRVKFQKMKSKLLIILLSFVFAEALIGQSIVDYQALISKADLKYDHPVKRSESGQPVGNGRMGSLIWTKPQALCFQINRADVFSNNSNSNMFDANVVDASVLMENGRDYCGGAGFVDIDFLSTEDIFSYSTFNQHLSCYDGTVETDGRGIKTTTSVWNKEDVMAVRGFRFQRLSNFNDSQPAHPERSICTKRKAYSIFKG